MKELITAFCLLSSMTSFAFDIPFPTKITRVDATYRCEKKGDGVAFRVPTRSAPAKVWHTEPGSDEGLELTVESFLVARCPGCYSFVANFGDNGEAGTVRGVTEMVNGKVYLNYEGTNEDGTVKLGRFRCLAVERR